MQTEIVKLGKMGRLSRLLCLSSLHMLPTTCQQQRRRTWPPLACYIDVGLRGSHCFRACVYVATKNSSWKLRCLIIKEKWDSIGPPKPLNDPEIVTNYKN